MADDSEANPSTDQLVQQEDDEAKKLKHLDFVRVAAVYVIVCSSTLYEYAKENSGPLKSGVRTVEAAVRSVVGPVLHRFHHLPLYLLQLADRKVDDTVTDLDRNVPAFFKQVSSQICSAAHKALDLALDLASELRRSGVVGTASHVARTVYVTYEPAAKELYFKYEPVAEKYAVTAWYQLNRLPLFPQVAHVVVPTAAYWAERYNQAVVYAADRGYTASRYLPLVPIDNIAKTFGNAEDGPPISANGSQDVAVSQGENFYKNSRNQKCL